MQRRSPAPLLTSEGLPERYRFPWNPQNALCAQTIPPGRSPDRTHTAPPALNIAEDEHSSPDKAPAAAPKPVSYTHLDVYKRQLQSSLLIHSHENTSNPEKKKEAKKKIRCGGERLRAGRGKRGAKERRLRPVSYTHLDVYKRQIQDALKDLLGGTIKEMMEAEMDDHLGYELSLIHI